MNRGHKTISFNFWAFMGTIWHFCGKAIKVKMRISRDQQLVLFPPEKISCIKIFLVNLALQYCNSRFRAPRPTYPAHKGVIIDIEKTKGGGAVSSRFIELNDL